MSEKTFRFNDCVIAEVVIAPIEQRIGRLVQIRKRAGAFGTDMYILRNRDGSLRTFENVLLRPYAEDLPFGPDKEGDAYTIKGEWEESGFIVENPRHQSPVQSFAMIITTPANPSLTSPAAT